MRYTLFLYFVAVLTKVISLDFKEALKMSLFQPNSQWLDGPIVIKSLQATLKDYIKDLHKWLSHPTEDGNKIITGVIKYIIYYYIEILLTSSHSIRLSHVILARIEEDVKCLNEVFKEYLASLFDNRLELLMLDLKPLNDLITLCHMDFKDAGTVMVNFIKTELYRDFGSSCIKVWQVIMNMKGESKDVSVVYLYSYDMSWCVCICFQNINRMYRCKKPYITMSCTGVGIQPLSSP